ncbi:MAG: hypothetical protein VYC88_02835, partial [SAR324 cluster bacterium]|nr:hypothetical protein [SAR324 cluster bacterium]
RPGRLDFPLRFWHSGAAGTSARLGKTRISAVSAMSGMAWPNRGLKDMTSMSGLRQDFPQENTFGLFNTPSAASARRLFALCVTRRGHWRLGDLELGGLEEACKRLGRGLEYLVGVVLGAQIS